MSSRNTIEEETETLTQQTILLDIPPRLQWDNGNGYCGEAALQSIGMSCFIFEYFSSKAYFGIGQETT